MGIKCEILLETPKKWIYGSGEPVIGTLQYSLEKPTTFEYIVIFFQGKLKGKKSWPETDDYITNNIISKEIFVSLHRNILKGKNVIEAGDYKHKFEFLLPKDLPSSFKNKTCTISYKILADFKVSGLFGGIKEFEKEIQVHGNVKPNLDQRLVYGLTKTPFPSDKPIDLEVEIEKKFFKAGENIHLNYTINNEADIPVTTVKTKLVTETTYRYDNKKKKVQRKALRNSVVESPGAKEDSEAKFSCVVPTTANLHSIQNSKFFKKEYKVVITANFPFPHTAASVEIPIVISGAKLLELQAS